MSDLKRCPYCCEEIQISASKCRYCLELLIPKVQPPDSETRASRLKVWLEFLGKLAIPTAIVVALLLFRPTVETLLKTTESAQFMGVTISFAKTKGFRGDLTPLGLYYLIGAADGGGIRYEGESVTPINEIRDKGLIALTINQQTTGSPEMQGTWAELTLTPAGVTFLESMGVTVHIKR